MIGTRAEREAKVKALAAGFLVAALMAALLLLAAGPAHAAPFTVNSMHDRADNNPGDGTCATAPFQVGTEPDCTLRAAIQESNANDSNDTIIFDPALGGTITLSLGELVIVKSLDIQGPGAKKITVSANDASTVFAIDRSTIVTISGLTISDGLAPVEVGERSIGGGILNAGTLTLTNATVSNNTADSGGGIMNDRETLTLINTTVSGNTADSGGGISNFAGTLRLTNATVSNNTARLDAGGIYNSDFAVTATLRNTIVARNGAPDAPDVRGTFNSEGNNLIGDTTAAMGFVAADLLNVNPLLGPLQNNGGSTQTHALLPGSPAVDAGANTACSFTDQRGVVRKDGDKDGRVVCDIGAFERNDLTPPRVTATTPSAGKTGVARNATLTATFSERMDRATLNRSTFKLYRVASNGTTTQITDVGMGSTADGLKAVLNPFGTSSTLLAPNARYRAVVTPGAKDRAGNGLDQNPSASGSQPMVWTFTTGGGG